MSAMTIERNLTIERPWQRWLIRLEGGRTAAVIEQRMAFQEVMRARFVAVIEDATGRQVVGFMSGNQQDPDMICEVFVLAPSDLFEGDEVRRSVGPDRGPT